MIPTLPIRSIARSKCIPGPQASAPRDISEIATKVNMKWTSVMALIIVRGILIANKLKVKNG
jgi:hypothetical protein